MQCLRVFFYSLVGIHVEFLYDPGGIFNYLLVTGRGVLSEGCDDLPDSHLFKSFLAFFVDAKISD